MLVMLLVNLCAMAWHQPAGQVVIPPNDDPGVYRAIIARTIQPELDRISAGAGMRTPAPVLTFDRTLMICRPAADHPRQMGCLEDIQSFETKLPRAQHVRFDGLLSPAAREELGRLFRERNRTPQPFPGAKLEGLIMVPPEGLDEAMRRESSRTRGVSSFSLRAYSADGHALVYGSYVCGFLCGYGWLFLLERRGDSWQVVSVDMLWMS
jgi:hypothetical protein